MNRRGFLKSTLAAAVAATLPAIPAADPIHYRIVLSQAPLQLLNPEQAAMMEAIVQGEIGRFEGITILPEEPSDLGKFAREGYDSPEIPPLEA